MPFRAAVSPHQEHVSGAAATGSAFAGEKGLFFKKSIPSGRTRRLCCLGSFFLAQASTQAHIRSGKFPFNTQNGSSSACPWWPWRCSEPYLALGIPLHLVPAPAPSLRPSQVWASGHRREKCFFTPGTVPSPEGTVPIQRWSRTGPTHAASCAQLQHTSYSAGSPPAAPCPAPLLPPRQPHTPWGWFVRPPTLRQPGLSCAGAAGEMSVGNFPLLSSPRSPFVCVSGSGVRSLPAPSTSRHSWGGRCRMGPLAVVSVPGGAQPR